MQCLGKTKVCVAHIFKVDRNKLILVHAGGYQFSLDQIQHDGLSAAADAG
ncbi:hypothetical protein SDC9_164517 [bioreactor metagenome]|uniref:Uncharacterized protein n=1 Tax=bioreactor metagenome TaxID=1076179 RepID=A0A645FRV9_9ZZZZ